MHRRRALPEGVYRSNCLVEALREYVRRWRAWARSGRPRAFEPHLGVRPSRLAPPWVPHFGVLERRGAAVVLLSFAPVRERALAWHELWRVLVFAGRWVEEELP